MKTKQKNKIIKMYLKMLFGDYMLDIFDISQYNK